MESKADDVIVEEEENDECEEGEPVDAGEEDPREESLDEVDLGR